MVNRYLSLVVAAVAPASAAVLLIAGAHPIGTVTLAERAPCAGLAALALALAFGHMRRVPTRSARAEAAMWQGLAAFFVVATFAMPNFGLWGIVATVSLAATSVARLVAAQRPSGASTQRPFRGRLFT
jgi:hypothetical protein